MKSFFTKLFGTKSSRPASIGQQARLNVEALEERSLMSASPSASIFQVQADVSRFVSDLPSALNTGIQAGRDLLGGLVYHNQAEYSRGLAEYNAAVGTVEGDYQRIQNDLSALQNVQAGVSSLPTFQRMEADTHNLVQGGLIAVYGAATLNNNVFQNGQSIARSAVNDYFAAINQALANLYQTAPAQGYDGFGYDPNAPKY